METARKRIIYFIENQGIKSKDFLIKTGLKKGFVDRSHQDSGITDIYLSKILECYPEINPVWLITGEGEMLKSDQEQKDPPDAAIYQLRDENYKLKDEIIRLQNEVIKLQKEGVTIKSTTIKTPYRGPAKLEDQ